MAKRFFWLIVVCIAAASHSTGQILSQYQYWYDGRYDSAVTQSISGGSYTVSANLFTGALLPGLHYVTFRARQSDGKWSAPVAASFIRTTLLTDYEYWFDGDYAGKTAATLGTPDSTVYLSSLIPASGFKQRPPYTVPACAQVGGNVERASSCELL